VEKSLQHMHFFVAKFPKCVIIITVNKNGAYNMQITAQNYKQLTAAQLNKFTSKQIAQYNAVVAAANNYYATCKKHCTFAARPAHRKLH